MAESRDITLNTHSFRIGGATALSLAGYPDSLIQVIGRWTQQLFHSIATYPRSPLSKKVQLAMCGANDDSMYWDPIVFSLRSLF